MNFFRAPVASNSARMSLFRASVASNWARLNLSREIVWFWGSAKLLRVKLEVASVGKVVYLSTPSGFWEVSLSDQSGQSSVFLDSQWVLRGQLDEDLEPFPSPSGLEVSLSREISWFLSLWVSWSVFPPFRVGVRRRSRYRNLCYDIYTRLFSDVWRFINDVLMISDDLLTSFGRRLGRAFGWFLDDVWMMFGRVLTSFGRFWGACPKLL